MTVFGRHGKCSLFPLPVTLCQNDLCKTCRHSVPEYMAVHKVCYRIFTHEMESAEDHSEMMDRLWRAGARRRPWKYAPVIRLDPEGITRLDSGWRAALGNLAMVAGLPEVADLPLELLHMVYEMSADALFWRAIQALRFRQELSKWLSPPPTTPIAHYLSLRHVRSWRRGQPLELVNGMTLAKASTTSTVELPPARPISKEDKKVPPEIAYIRITIDHYGICRIERMSHHPAFTPHGRVDQANNDSRFAERGFAPHGQRIYMVDRVQRLPRFDLVYFPYDGAVNGFGVVSGCVRFRKRHYSDHDSNLWDLPAPPPLAYCVKIPLASFDLVNITNPRGLECQRSLPVQLTTTKLHGDYRHGGCSGLTFLYVRTVLHQIYVHRHPRDGALALALAEMPRIGSYNSQTWIYMPIGPADHVDFMAARDPALGRGTTTLMVKMKLAGDVIIGATSHHLTMVKSIFSIGAGPDLTLLYGGESRDLGNITWLGTFPESFPVKPIASEKLGPLNYKQGTGTNGDYDPSVRYLTVRSDMHLSAIKAARSTPGARFLAWAPLTGLDTVRVFRRLHTRYFWGMILYYSNGAQRAIGECRVNVDGEEGAEEELVRRPTRICFRSEVTPDNPATTLLLHHIVLEVGVEDDGVHAHGWEQPREGGEEGEEDENTDEDDGDSGSENPVYEDNNFTYDNSADSDDINTAYPRRPVNTPADWTCCILRDGGALSCAFDRGFCYLFHFPYMVDQKGGLVSA